jgi:hypothetical protein
LTTAAVHADHSQLALAASAVTLTWASSTWSQNLVPDGGETTKAQPLILIGDTRATVSRVTSSPAGPSGLALQVADQPGGERPLTNIPHSG